MAFVNKFEFAPAPWLPLQDREMLDTVMKYDFCEHQNDKFENPDFSYKIVYDVHNYFAADLFYRIKCSDVQNKKLVMLLPSPENAVFISLADTLSKYRVSCRNVEIFFLCEYANEKGEVAPWQSPYSRSGQFMKHFYNRLDPALRMPMSQIHFFTTENAASYSDELAAMGGADVAYTTISRSGGIGAIDAESFAAASMDEFRKMGSRIVTPMPETIAEDSLRGMFGCSGDVSDVPPCCATVGPRDLLAAKEHIGVQYLTACGGDPAHQKPMLKLALFGPLAPNNPGALMRLLPGICYISEAVAAPSDYSGDCPWLEDKLEEIRQKEAK